MIGDSMDIDRKDHELCDHGISLNGSAAAHRTGEEDYQPF